MTDQTQLDHWLRRLGWALGSLPAGERDDIVRETRSHIEDRIAAGAPVDRVLSDFGPAERHARQFVDEMQAYEALGSQGGVKLAWFVANRAHRSLAAAATLLLLLLLIVAAIITLGLVGLEVYDPARTGVWVGPGTGFVGLIADPSLGREVLGPWLFPAAALVLTVIFVTGRLLLSLIVPLLATGYNRVPEVSA